LVLNPGSFASYKWQDNSTNPTFTVTQTGDYSVQVVDADGCTGSGAVKITVDCKDVYFPSAFTPNGDITNPGFGVIGDIASLQQYSIDIYNRYGQKVFSSTDPNKKWDGRFKGVPSDMQTFIWFATYTQRGRIKQTRKGTITLIR
jgi:gliding motility-associated-like protein